MVRRRRPAACSPTSGDEQTPQIHISTSTRLQRAFECTAHDALDTLKLLSNAPSTRPQRALNAPSKGSNVLTMHPRPQCPQRDSNTPSRCPSCTPHKVCLFNQFYGKNLQVLFLSLAPPTGTCCFFLRAILGCDTTPLVPLRLIIGCPPPPHPPVPVTPLVLRVILGQHCRSLPSACPMAHWTPLFMVRVKATSLLISRVPVTVTHPILCVILPQCCRSPPSACRHHSPHFACRCCSPPSAGRH